MSKRHNSWAWVPTLYFAEGLPYVLVVTVSAIMFKQLGISNADIALYTSWLYLPWVIKPFWSPFVDLIKTKRWWLLLTQLILGAGLAGVALTLNTTDFFKWSLAILWLLAFSSATHDIAIDGFYMLGLSEGEQSLFVGIRNTAYRIAMIAGQGGLLILVGLLEKSLGSTVRAWSLGFMAAGGVMILLWLYHSYILPYPTSDRASAVSGRNMFREFGRTVVSYFKKPNIIPALLFILLFRFPEAQIVKIAPLFLVDDTAAGGLGLTTSEVGFSMGTLGVIGLLLGGILGGITLSKFGLRKCIWYMVAAISIPDLVYVYLSWFPTNNLALVSSCIFIEQMGYGFGFTAYTLFLIYFARGEHKTSHYAISTGIMALGMMLPGMISGWLQEIMGYRLFFIWIMFCCLITCAVSAIIKYEPDFGKKQ
ncbi:MAG: AmpG family muropeptide MFS transporter [Bacteroidales bacterium]|jgi:PAT family beta-lactamase induction signal transducer AmpG|nr:AmpG family muropeptide MFS transporter [Bacteroidales bacterium]